MRHRHLLPAAIVVGVLALTGCGSQSIAGSTPAAATSAAAASPAAKTGQKAEAPKPDGVYSFGDTVKFDDGSTLTVAKPVAFQPAQYASGGEKAKHHIKFKVTFTNKAGRVFDPTLTTVRVSSDDQEAEEVFQDGLGSPMNKILPEKKVTWWNGFGVKSSKKWTVTVQMGAFDYADAIFTNDA